MKELDGDIAALRQAVTASSNRPGHAENVATLRRLTQDLTATIESGGGVRMLTIGDGGIVIPPKDPKPKRKPRAVVVLSYDTAGDAIGHDQYAAAATAVSLSQKACPNCGTTVL